MTKRKGKFYTTKECLILSFSLLISALIIAIVLVSAFDLDIYTRAYRKARERLFSSLGIKIIAEKSTNEALLSAFILDNVEIKIQGDDEPLLSAERIAFNQSFFSIVMSLTGLPVPLDVSVKNAHLNIKDRAENPDQNIDQDIDDRNGDDFISDRTSNDQKQSEKKFNIISVLKHGVSINLESFKVDIASKNNSIHTDPLDVFISFDRRLNFKEFELNIPNLLLNLSENENIEFGRIKASKGDSNRIDMLFDDLRINNNTAESLTFSLENLSPYIERDSSRNQTLHVPLSNLSFSRNGIEISSESDNTELICQFIGWNDINVLFNSDLLRLKLSSYGNPDITLSSLNFKYNYGQTNEVTLTSNIETKNLLFLKPFKGEIDGNFKDPFNNPKGNIAIDNVVFDRVDDVFSLLLSLENGVINTSFTSNSQSDNVKELTASAMVNLNSFEFDASVLFSSFHGKKMLMFIPDIGSLLLSNASLVNGEIKLKGRGDRMFDASGDAHVVISNLHFLNQRSAMTIDGALNVEDGIVNIRNTEINLFGFRFTLDGKYNLKTSLPDITAILYKNDTEYARGTFIEDGGLYRGKITSLDGVITFDGLFNLNNPLSTTANGLLTIYNNNYAFDINFDNKTKYLMAITDGLSIKGYAMNKGLINIAVNNLSFPKLPFIKVVDSKVNSSINIDLTGELLKVTSDGVNLAFENGSVLDFKLDATRKNIHINDIQVKTGIEMYTGAFFVNTINDNGAFSPFNIKVGGSLHSSSLKSTVNISYVPNDNSATLYLDMKGFKGFSTIKGNPFDGIDVSLLATTNLKDKHTVFGSIKASGDRGGDKLNIDIGFNNNVLTLSNFDLSYGNIKIDDAEVTLNFTTGDARLNSYITAEMERVEENSVFSFMLDAVSNIKPLMNAEYNLRNITDVIKGTVKFHNANFHNTFYPSDFTTEIEITSESIKAIGKTLNGFYNFDDSTLSINLDKSFTIGFSANGSVKNGIIDIQFDNVYFPFNYLDLLIWGNSVKFGDGIFEGSVRLVGDTSNPQWYGNLSAKSAVMWNLWAENELCTIMNPKIVAFGNTLNILKTDVFARNTKTGRISRFMVGGKLHLEKWDLPLIELVIDIDKDNPVSVSVPLPQPNLNVDVEDVWGHFEMDLYYLNFPDIRFDLEARDGTLAPPARFPRWLYDPSVPSKPINIERSKKYTKLDGNLKIEKGMSFKYPSVTNPFINASIGENQEGRIEYKDGRFTVDSDLALRSGEIFYFQKNFLITEGTLSWHSMANMGEILESSMTNGFLKQYAADFAGINLSLSARLKDYDANGNPVDIYLSFENATLDNLTPRFSSSTGLSDAEILLILGQNILPTSTYSSTGLSSLAYMSSVALDVVTKLGVIEPLGKNTLGDTLTRALGLDMFSVRQRIFYNVIADVIPGFSGDGEYGYAFSRYLNGTTIFLGKNVTNDLFFQASFHFLSPSSSQSSGKTKNLFIQGLTGEAEFSLEWNTPLATISIFTNPSELSFLDFLNNIGINIKRHFVL